MSDSERPCPTCKSETERHRIDTARGLEDPLAVTVHGLPVLRCGEGHVHFVAMDYPLKLVEHLMKEDEPELPAADRKGLLFRKSVCHDCGAALEAEADHRHTFEVSVVLDDDPPVGVELSMPVYRCSGCGKQQLHSLDELREHTPGALAKAFESGGIAREM